MRPTSGRCRTNRTINGQGRRAKLTPVRRSRYRPAAYKENSPKMLSTLREFADWLSMTSMSNTIQTVSWIIPAIQTIHIVCVAVVIASTFLVDLRILGIFSRSQPLAALSHRFLTWIWYALILLLVTGALLIVGEPGRSLMNPAFFAKMIMLLIVAGLTVLLQRPLAANAGYWEASGGRIVTAKVIAVLSLVLWSCIVFAGRWIAYITAY
jgi:hypothetical protein